MTRWTDEALFLLHEYYPIGASDASAALAGAGYAYSIKACHIKAHRTKLKGREAHRPALPIGALSIGSEGYRYISVPLDYPFERGKGYIGRTSILYYYHYYCWEQVHQCEVPEGMHLYFKDGDITNCSPSDVSNLEPMLLSDHAKINNGVAANQAYWLKQYGSLSALYSTPDLELVYNKHGKLIWKKI
jgi:hypothetical protein